MEKPSCFFVYVKIHGFCRSGKAYMIYIYKGGNINGRHISHERTLQLPWDVRTYAGPVKYKYIKLKLAESPKIGILIYIDDII